MLDSPTGVRSVEQFRFDELLHSTSNMTISAIKAHTHPTTRRFQKWVPLDAIDSVCPMWSICSMDTTSRIVQRTKPTLLATTSWSKPASVKGVFECEAPCAA